jgi:large subunit ribosomal protein L4
MQVNVYSNNGAVVGTIELPKEIFGVEPNEHVMYLAVKAYLTNQRQGNAKTKVRDEVSGGGKKPWKQKGRGTARSGSNRSPVWVGGGTVHGPKPHDFNIDLNKKVKRLAKKSALSLRATEGNIVIVDDVQFGEVKTKPVVQMLKALNVDTSKTLLLLPTYDQNAYLSARNIEHLQTLPALDASTYDILRNKKVVIFKSAIDKLVATLGS